jgi:polysaccharide export outer membrane protein
MKWTFSLLVICFLILFSCRTSKPIPYLQGALDSSAYKSVNIPEPVIQKGDLLNITIFSDNPTATAIYNQAAGGGAAAQSGSSSSGGTSGYLVDIDGNIRLHAIGILHVEGLTKKQLSDLVTQKLTTLQSLTNPYVVIRFENFKITVIGEVKAQGIFNIPGEKASVLEALGLAGGMTDFGRKDNVLLIRENQGKREYTYLDLSKANVFASPYFFLQQNDVIVVDVDPKKQTLTDQENMRTFTIALTLISTIALLTNLVLRF